MKKGKRDGRLTIAPGKWFSLRAIRPKKEAQRREKQLKTSRGRAYMWKISEKKIRRVARQANIR